MKANLLLWHIKDIRVAVVTTTLDHHVSNAFVMPVTVSTYTKQVSRNSYPSLCGQKLKLEMIKSGLEATHM